MKYLEMSDDERDDFICSIKEDADASSVTGWIRALTIFGKHFDKGMKETYFCGGEHDAVYFYVETEILEPTSEDGKILISLAFHPDTDSGNWCKFT